MEKASFAAGCFWGIESKFRKIKGVVKTTAGYQGGNLERPSYKDVCSGQTGHAETVLVEFDPQIVSYQELLEAFWKMHNPTTPNRQGPDVGSQYRSVIFCYSEEQKTQATVSKEEKEDSGIYTSSIVTEIQDATPFYPAEEYHQCYLEKRENSL